MASSNTQIDDRLLHLELSLLIWAQPHLGPVLITSVLSMLVCDLPPVLAIYVLTVCIKATLIV